MPKRSGTKSTDQSTTRPARPSRRWTRPRAHASGLNPNQASTRGRRSGTSGSTANEAGGRSGTVRVRRETASPSRQWTTTCSLPCSGVSGCATSTTSAPRPTRQSRSACAGPSANPFATIATRLTRSSARRAASRRARAAPSSAPSTARRARAGTPRLPAPARSAGRARAPARDADDASDTGVRPVERRRRRSPSAPRELQRLRVAQRHGVEARAARPASRRRPELERAGLARERVSDERRPASTTPSRNDSVGSVATAGAGAAVTRHTVVPSG